MATNKRLLSLLTLLLFWPGTLFAQNISYAGDKAAFSAVITKDLLLDKDRLRSPIIIRNQQLGVLSLQINSLKLHTRNVIVDNNQGHYNSRGSLYLGKAAVSIRRGINLRAPKSRKVLASISAKIVADKQEGPSYLKIRFIKERKIGRVFELSIPLESKLASVRQISLRALSNKICDLHEHNSQKLDQLAIKDTSSNQSTKRIQTLAANISTKIFTVSTDCDFECYSKLGRSAANDKILEFYNTVNLYYENDFNINFDVTSQISRTSSVTYPSSTTDSDSLLNIFKSQSSNLESADFKHLITGKSMRANVVGLSYVGVACTNPSFSIGYSQHVNDLLTPIIIAHEMGHNLNATHDPDSEGIMTTILGLPYPTSFSQFSKNEIQNFINDFGRFACYTSGINISALFSAKLSKTNFTSSITQPQGSNCSVELRAAQSKANLESKATTLFSSSISNLEKISLLAANMPRVKVSSNSQKAPVWFNIISSCSEGSNESKAKSINVAISSQKAGNSKTLKNTKAWINKLKNSLARQ